MAFDNNITVKNAANEDKVFKLVSRQNRRTERRRSDSSVDNDTVLIIDHADVKPKAFLQQTRSSVQIANTANVLGETEKSRNRLMLIVEVSPSPHQSAEQIIEDMWANMTDLMNNPGFRESLMLGES